MQPLWRLEHIIHIALSVILRYSFQPELNEASREGKVSCRRTQMWKQCPNVQRGNKWYTDYVSIHYTSYTITLHNYYHVKVTFHTGNTLQHAGSA